MLLFILFILLLVDVNRGIIAFNIIVLCKESIYVCLSFKRKKSREDDESGEYRELLLYYPVSR